MPGWSNTLESRGRSSAEPSIGTLEPYIIGAAPISHLLTLFPTPTGFYVLDPTSHGKSLILGPFMGQVACQTIDFGRGVCGTAAATKQTQLVPDVDAFPGHIACDGASRSEIVVPVAVEVVSPEEGGHVERKVVGISELALLFDLFLLSSTFFLSFWAFAFLWAVLEVDCCCCVRGLGYYVPVIISRCLRGPRARGAWKVMASSLQDTSEPCIRERLSETLGSAGPALAGWHTTKALTCDFQVDIDCAEKNGFDETDKKYLEELAALLGRACDW